MGRFSTFQAFYNARWEENPRMQLYEKILFLQVLSVENFANAENFIDQGSTQFLD